MYAIRELRKKAGLTQVELAHLLGFKSTSIISMWESGDRSPRTDKLPELARILHCRIDDLFERGTG